jgi:hypothetical protein
MASWKGSLGCVLWGRELAWCLGIDGIFEDGFA